MDHHPSVILFKVLVHHSPPHLTSPSLVAQRVGYVKYRRFPSRLHCLRNCCRQCRSLIIHHLPTVEEIIQYEAVCDLSSVVNVEVATGTPQQVVAASPHTY